MLLAVFPGSPVAGQGIPGLWRPEERAVIPDLSFVQGLALNSAYLFVATRNGLGILDRRFGQWLPPVTASDGFPNARVFDALEDPVDDSVWLATEDGLFRYDPRTRFTETVLVPGGVAQLMIDRDQPFRGIYLRTSSGWQLLPRGGVVPAPPGRLPPPGNRVQSLGVEEAMRLAPMAEGLTAEILTDRRLRRYRYTAAAYGAARDELYLGTNGAGVVKLDQSVARFERLTFGLLEPGAGAIVADRGGVWVGTDHRSQRSGFTWVSEDLQQYRYWEGPPATGLPFHGVREMLLRDGELWAATDLGVFRLEGAERAERFDRTSNLPDDETFALAMSTAGVWVGTALGLGLIRDDGSIDTWTGAVPPVLALATVGDTAWVGTTDGLGFTLPGEHRILVPQDVTAIPEMNVSIVDLDAVNGTVVAVSPERVFFRLEGEAWRAGPLVAPQLGVIFAVVLDGPRAWLGGERGVGFLELETGAWRAYNRAGDVPGRVSDLAVDERYLWVATEAGLVRFDRTALLP